MRFRAVCAAVVLSMSFVGCSTNPESESLPSPGLKNGRDDGASPTGKGDAAKPAQPNAGAPATK
jgi:hypothetical protein